MTFGEARAILVRHCYAYDGKEPSANKRAYPRPRTEGRSRQWWLNPRRNPDNSNTPRVRAYLAAYREMSGGGDHLPAEGIRLDDGSYLWLDKGVMKTALVRDLIDFDEGAEEFRLTSR